MTTDLLPCPFCGAMPEVDLGFSDAPYPPGHEFISCPTVFINVPGGPDQSCGAHAQGAAAWNRRADNSARLAAALLKAREGLEETTGRLRHNQLCGYFGGYDYCTCGIDEVRNKARATLAEIDARMGGEG